MNTLVIVLIAAVLLCCAYVFYGRWLANKWGIDPKAETPAKKFADGKDYVPTDGWTVFSHQFSSIAGAGPVTGAIQAAVFGWLPVLLWVLIGGIFFGAVTDFGALYASVKNDGKSMGLLIEKYIGKFGRKLFLLFCWLFTLLVIAAFAGPSLRNALIAIAISWWPWYARIVRGQAISLKERQFVKAARALGNVQSKIIFQHIVPNCMGPVIVQATMDLGGIILTLASLSFLGLGAQAPTPEWGLMINTSKTYFMNAWWYSVFPGLAIFVTVLAFNLIGDGLREIMDPRTRIK